MLAQLKSLRLFWSALGLLLSGLLWILAAACFPISMWSGLPTGRIAFGALFSTAIALIQWRLLRTQLSINVWAWLIANALGMGLGLALGFQLAGPEPQPISQFISLGWDIYKAKVFAVAGTVLGLMLWLTLRPQVRRTVWLVGAGLIAGLGAGAFEGGFIDSYMLVLGMTSNNEGERLGGASLFAIPMAHVYFGTLMGATLALVLLQAHWQRRNSTAA